MSDVKDVKEEKILTEEEEEVKRLPEDESEEVKESEEKKEEESQRYVRLMAEFQNYKKRVDKEKKDTYAFANEKIVTELLDVIDNFERGLEAECADKNFFEGTKLIFDQLQGVLAKSGLEEIEALGQGFDPMYHNALMMQDSEEHKSGEIISVMQKGYKLKSKVIRPAMVIVAN
ncbi:MAG: nucleotide exchange factor GrpE [Clostridiales bacterium]|nr:nucleotide exchange factor GrpE [Clostridiales bacterium]